MSLAEGIFVYRYLSRHSPAVGGTTADLPIDEKIDPLRVLCVSVVKRPLSSYIFVEVVNGPFGSLACMDLCRVEQWHG